METPVNSFLGWRRWCLQLAGFYNLAWGASVIIWPNWLFELNQMPLPNYPELWQCVGMIVGVYGVGYLIAANDPVRHWPIVLVGLLGKVLGPMGFLQAALAGRFPWSFGLNIFFNDLIWWIPFAAILWYAWRQSSRQQGMSSARSQSRLNSVLESRLEVASDYPSRSSRETIRN